MSLTTKLRSADDVETVDGHATFFVNIDGEVPSVKLDDGTVLPLAGASGSAALTPVAYAVMQLGADTEAILWQVGDVITGINVVGPGEYELTLDPAAGLTLSDRIGVQVAVVGSNIAGQERFASYFPQLGSNLITVYVFNAAGTGVAAARATITIWYDSTPEMS